MFRAEARGKELHFENAGVIGGNEVFRDRESGSRWQQSSLEAISGPMKGEHLELRPFLLTSWGEWRKLHPDTLVLKPLPGYAERIAATNERVREGLLQRGNAPDGVLRIDNRLPPKTMILGLNAGGAGKAFPLNALRKARVINDKVGVEPVLIVHQPGSDTTTAFSAKLNGRVLRFAPANISVTEIIDLETHSHWDAYGQCVSGKLKDSSLKPLILEPEYWFAWSEFHPATGIYSPSASN
ncbi:MAG: DUF3179 domain-containing protein [Bryobacterales bacterium]|nr:DUF3179 domain-containing protein [Bryobacterales bacterium]